MSTIDSQRLTSNRFIAHHPWRWTMLVLIVAGGGICLAAFIEGWVVMSYKPSREIIYLWAGFELALLVWIIRLAPIRPVNRVRLICGFCLFKALLWMLIHVEGYYGDGRPVFAWRMPALLDRPATSETTTPSATKSVVTGSTSNNRQPHVYPGFRGVDRTGIVRDVDLQADWQADPPRVLWRRPMGTGWSSFAIVGYYAVTQEQRDADEVVSCYDLLTGTERWSHADRTFFHEVTGGDGPRATPCIHNGRVFALGATGILNCLDLHNGRRLWSRNILSDANSDNRIFGMAGSPMIVDEQVIVCPGGQNSTLISYDIHSGGIIWHGGDSDASYSSPQWSPFHHGRQVLIFHADGLSGHDPVTGSTLWDYDWISQPSERNNVCQPIPLPGSDSRADRVFLSSGYGQGCALIELTARDGRWSVRELWHNRNLKAKFSSAVMSNGYVYGMDEAILTCIDVETGERKWKKGRYGYGQLILVGDKLLIQAENGDIALVAADPEEFRELTSMPVLNDRTWNHPALAGPYLLVRNDREAACIELPIVDPSVTKAVTTTPQTINFE